MSLQEEVRAIAERAKEASVALAGASGEQRNAALRAMAQALRDNASAMWPPLARRAPRRA